MKKITKIFLLGALLLTSSMLSAQNMSDMRLNEILVSNTDGYVDDYGNRSGWIELFNTSYGTVDISGCFLTDDPNNLKKYRIPKGDVLTKIKPRQHVLFYTDAIADRGTFHTNFEMTNAKEILLVSSNGRTIIDRIALPTLADNQSYGRIVDGEGSHQEIPVINKSYNINKKDEAAKENRGGWSVLGKATPSSNNVILDGKTKADAMGETDPTGVIMAITAMSVVFLSLLILFLVFKTIGNVSIKKSTAKASKVAAESSAKGQKATATGDTSAEVHAAIAMACHLFRQDSDAHDFENTILTIAKVSKSYSPWSSKIHTLRETPQLKK